MTTITTQSVEETLALGFKLSLNLRAGSTIALSGDLGAGKTHLAKGLVSGLGSEAEVTSPTFTILQEYDGGRFPIYHIDLYRLEDIQQADEIGLDEVLFGEGVAIVEWAEKFPELMPDDAIRIEVSILNGDLREWKIEGVSL